MPYPQAFLEIQLTFARKMAELTGTPYQESVLRNTALYRILGLDWSLDPLNPVWQQFINALQDSDSESDAAYGIYRDRYTKGLVPDYDTSRPHWGCFAYEYHPDAKAIRLHFANLDTSGYGPLSHQRKEYRIAELRSLFSHVKVEHADAERVLGGTWLYNRAEYRRLFPPVYGESARVDHPHLIARGLWGQFLRHDNSMNEEITARFLARLSELRDPQAYANCFPYQSLLTEASIQSFYEFYGISEPQ